jgi:spermidine/putrescine transport system substrate-binding protein
MKRISVLLVLTLLFGALLTGCTGGEDERVLNVYNWGEYIDESVLEQFEEETGIRVNYETFATNEDMYVKVKQGGGEYDVIFPSDYMIEKMINEDMLAEIDLDQIPNYQYIEEQFKNLGFDPENRYSVPYFWGTVGILYNTELVDDPVNSWDILWDEKYAKQITMIDSQRDSIGVALKKLGYSLNTRDEAELEEAKELLIEQKPLVLAYTVDNVKDILLSGDAALAVVWSGEAVAIMSEFDQYAYALPEEGTNIWFDSMVVMKDTPNYEEAMAFINFMSDPEIAYLNTDYVGYSTVNGETREMLDEEILSMNAAYPDEADIEKAEVFLDPGDFIEAYNRAWTEIKAAN